MPNQKVMRLDSKTETLSCSLTDPEFVERKNVLQKEVFSHVKEVQEVSNGYLFAFDDTEGLLPTLFNYIMAEKKCCPFFEQEVSVKPYAAGINWKVSGGEGVKDILKLLIDELAKGEK